MISAVSLEQNFLPDLQLLALGRVFENQFGGAQLKVISLHFADLAIVGMCIQ